jgi:transposase
VIPSNVSIYVATQPVDMRWSFDVLSGIVKDRMRGDPRAGDLFAFHNKTRTRLKILFYDRNGYCVLYKRLDRGTFMLPTVIEPGATHVAVSNQELALILQGIDIKAMRRRPNKKSEPVVH